MNPSGPSFTEAAGTLRDGLREQRQIYGRLEECTRRQGEILLGGRTDEILELARAKESSLDTIDAVERRIAPIKARWREERDSLPVGLREEVQAELDALHGVLESLIALESEQQSRVDSVRSETQDKLKRIEGGRRVHQAYGASPARPQSPRYLDRSE